MPSLKHPAPPSDPEAVGRLCRYANETEHLLSFWPDATVVSL